MKLFPGLFYKWEGSMHDIGDPLPIPEPPTPAPCTLLDMVNQRLATATAEVERLLELKRLLEDHPEVERVRELLEKEFPAQANPADYWRDMERQRMQAGEMQ